MCYITVVLLSGKLQPTVMLHLTLCSLGKNCPSYIFVKFFINEPFFINESFYYNNSKTDRIGSYH